MNFADLIPRLITIASDVGKEIIKVYEGNHKFLQLKKDQSLLMAKRSKSIDGCRPYIASLPKGVCIGGRFRGFYRVQRRAFGTDFYASCHDIKIFRGVASKNHLNIATSDFINRLRHVRLVQTGSSLKFCLIAKGTIGIYPRQSPICESSTASAQAVLDLVGNSVHYGKQAILNPFFYCYSQ